MTDSPAEEGGGRFGFALAGRFTVHLFLVLQGLTLVFNAPAPLLKYGRSLLMAMPLSDIAGDWAMAALMVSAVNLAAAILCGSIFLAVARHPVLARGWERGVLTASVAMTGFFLFNSLLEEWRTGESTLLVSGYMALALAVAVAILIGWRWHGLRDPVAARLRWPGVAFTVLPFLLLPFWPGGPPPPVTASAMRGPNIILLVVDTLSAPAMSLYGASLPTTPRLAQFASGAVVFDRLIAGSNTTTPSVATFLSGTYPSRNRVQQMGGYFIDTPEIGRGDLLPRRLRAAGYRTAAITANPSAYAGRLHLAESFDDMFFLGSPCRPLRQLWAHLGNSNLLGMDAYFERLTLINNWASRISCGGRTVTDVPSETSYASALQWLDRNAQTGRPFFLWVQPLPPHDPYLPPKPFLQAFDKSDRFVKFSDAGQQYLYRANPGPVHAKDIAILRHRYAENIAYADSALGDFLDGVKRRGLMADTILVITSDHGESFGRWIGHQGPFLDQPLISVPLVIAGPGLAPGRRVRDLVSHADIAPTLLDMAGLKPGAAMQGRSLRPLLEGGSLAARPVFSMQIETSSRSGPLTHGTVAVLDGDWKYVRYLQEGREELFDLSRDPGESHNLIASQQDVTRRLRDILEGQLANDGRAGSGAWNLNE